MKLIIQRNVRICISSMDYDLDNEEIYEDVYNIRMEGKRVRKVDVDGSIVWCNLVLFNDKQHTGLLNSNYVYVSDKDVMEIK